MAPFKLKFRMGSGSRSLSQELEEPVQQPLLTRQSAIKGSNTTLNSEYNSMSTNNDQHNLLPNKFDEETGYENPTIMRNMTDAHCYQNIQTSSSNSTISHNDQFQTDSEGNITSDGITHAGSKSKYDNKECSVAGSCDPLFTNQSLEHINLEEDATTISMNDDEQRCSSSLSIDNQNNDNDDDDDDDWNSHNNRLEFDDMSSQLDTIINNKNSKKIYKAVAKEWGITCKMSEQCRCLDCQGNYFDCEYDENDQQKTDGGLGASAPMFLHEVMHQSSCTII